MSDVAYDPLRYAQAGRQRVNDLYGDYASRIAGGQLANGNAQGAAQTLYRSGDLGAGQAVEQQAASQATARTAAETARKQQELQATLNVTRALRGARDRGEDVTVVLEQYRPLLGQFGIDDAQYQNLSGLITSDPTVIDRIEDLAGRQAQELSFQKTGDNLLVFEQGNPDPVRQFSAPRAPINVGGVLVDPNTYQPILDTREPQYQTITNSDGSTSLVAVDQPAPVAMAGGGGGGSLDTMASITAQTESGNRERDANGNLITSSAGAQGRMQVMPGTNTDPGFGVRPAQDNSDGERTRVGRDYLAAMMQQYGNDPAKAWAAYNWGPGNLDRAIQQYGGNWLQAAPTETQRYVSQNLAALNQGGGQQGPQQGGVRTVATGQNLGPRPSEVRAEQAAANRQGREDTRAQSALRREFNGRKEVAEFREVDNSYRAMEGFANNPSAAGDISMIFQFMKVLDPTSTVREGEFATAQNAGGIDESFRNRLNRIVSGERLQPSQRQDFLSQARNLRDSRQQRYGQIEREYAFEAEQQGFDPQRIIGGQQQPQNQRQTRTNAPGLPFDITPQQLQFRQGSVQGGRANPRSPRGSQDNPIYINPQTVEASFANVRPDQYYVTPDGRLARRQPTQRRRR